MSARVRNSRMRTSGALNISMYSSTGCVHCNVSLFCESLWANITAIMIYMLHYDIIYLIALHPSCSVPATIGTRHKHRLLSLMMMSHVLTERRTGQMSHGPWQSTLGDWWFYVNDVGDQNQRFTWFSLCLGFTWFTYISLIIFILI